MPKILILGLGNVLLNDEGIGVHAISRMEKMKWPENIDLLDGGTGGFTLLSLFQEYDTIIIIDATLEKNNQDQIKVIEPNYPADFPPTLSSHSLGLKDMIESAILLEHLPKIYLVAVPIKTPQDMQMELSESTKKTIPAIIHIVKTILKDKIGLPKT